MPGDVLSVAELRIVVQDQLEKVYLSSYELPLVRSIERSVCEDVLVGCYRDAAAAVIERDLCRVTLAKFESAIDLLLAIDTTDDTTTDDDDDQISRPKIHSTKRPLATAGAGTSTDATD